MPLGPRATIYGKTAGSSEGSGKASAEVTSVISANAGSIHIAAGQDAAVADSGMAEVAAQAEAKIGKVIVII